MPWSSVSAFCKSTLNGIASALNSTGASVLWVQTRGSLVMCDPESVDLCDFVLVKEVGVLGVALAWVDYCLQWIKLIPKISEVPRFTWLSKCHSTWNIMTDIIGVWSFFVLVLCVLFSEIKGDDYPLDQHKEFIPIIVSSLLVALLSNVKIRLFLLHCVGVIEPERRFMLKCVDGFFELCRGFAAGRELILACETIYDEFHGKDDVTKSTGAEVARYVAGFSWAAFAGVMGYRYGPNLALADLFPDEIVQRSVRAFSITLNGLFPMITFGVLLGGTIAKNSSPLQEILSVVLALLLPAIMARSYYVHIKRVNQQAMALFQTSLLRSDIAEDEITANLKVETVEQDKLVDQRLLTAPPSATRPAIASMGQPRVSPVVESGVNHPLTHENLSFSI